MSKNKILIVDVSNVMYRAWWSSQRDLELKPWMPVLRFIDMIRLAGVKTGCDSFIFAGESKTKLKRSFIDPTYKEHRHVEGDPKFTIFKRTCFDVIEHLWYKIITVDGAEADDVIASTVKKIDGTDTEIFIFSNDKDLNQLLAFDNVYIYKTGGHIYSRDDFIFDYRFHPRHFNMYKAMVGDKSDGIAGCYGFGPARATQSIINNSVYEDVTAAGQFDNYTKALALVELDYNLDVPSKGSYGALFEDDLLELLKKYSPKAAEELNLYMVRFNETFGV